MFCVWWPPAPWTARAAAACSAGGGERVAYVGGSGRGFRRIDPTRRRAAPGCACGALSPSQSAGGGPRSRARSGACPAVRAVRRARRGVRASRAAFMRESWRYTKRNLFSYSSTG